jgi:hypothetical protein
MLRAQPGFRLYCAFESEGDATAVAVSVVDGRDQATRANAEVLQWARRAAGDLLLYPPEIVAGPCAVRAVGDRPPRQDGAAPYVTVRQHYGLGPEEKVMPLVREHVLPLLVRAPGFRAFYAFMNREQPGQGVGVMLFDSRAGAVRANDAAIAAMLEKGIAPRPPKVTAGQALVLAVAEAAPLEAGEARGL